MNAILRVGLMLVILLLLTAPAGATLDPIEGTVVGVNYQQRSFQICPEDAGCGATEDSVFLVDPDTLFRHILNMRDLEVGDRIAVEGEPYNEVVWKAYTVRRL